MRLRNKSGATLIELLTVCTIVLVVAGLSMHGLTLVQHMAARSELALLHSTCRYLQKVAIATHQEQRLRFNIPSCTYTYGANIHTLHGSVVFGYPPLAKGPPACPNTLLHSSCTFVDNTIVFYPTGIMSAGSVYLSNASRSCCYALSNGISHVSYVRCYEYKKNWQPLFAEKHTDTGT